MSNLRNHYLLRHLFRWIDNFRAGRLTVEGLQQNIWALSTALEGDVPEEIREALFNVDADIEMILYSGDSSTQRERTEAMLAKLVALIDSYQ